MENNAEARLLKKVMSPDLCAQAGSRLYGTARYDAQGNCLSDDDLRGFVLPPFEYIVGVKNFEMFKLEGDHNIWNLKRYIDLLLNGDPVCLELLFSPKSAIRVITPIGERVLDSKNIFASKKVFFRVMGYASSEFRKSLGLKLLEEDRTQNEDQVIMSIRNTFALPKPEMDEVLSILFSHHKKTLISSKQSIGEKRKLEFEKYGYGTSSACHTIRLARQCVEFLKTGNITFPRPDADQLRAIRYGQVPQKDFEALYEEVNREAKQAYDDSKLPDKPNYADAEKLYLEIVDSCLQRQYVNPNDNWFAFWYGQK